MGGLPPTGNEQNIATFFSNALAAVGGTTAGPGAPLKALPIQLLLVMKAYAACLPMAIDCLIDGVYEGDVHVPSLIGPLPALYPWLTRYQ